MILRAMTSGYQKLCKKKVEHVLMQRNLMVMCLDLLNVEYRPNKANAGRQPKR